MTEEWNLRQITKTRDLICSAILHEQNNLQGYDFHDYFDKAVDEMMLFGKPKSLLFNTICSDRCQYLLTAACENETNRLQTMGYYNSKFHFTGIIYSQLWELRERGIIQW